MTSNQKNTINFFKLFYEQGKIPWPYLNVGYKANNKEILFLENHDYLLEKDQKIGSFSLIPEYLKLTIGPEMHLKKIHKLNKGYLINLQNFNDINAYVKNQFKSESKIIMKRVNRLSTCFEIHFKVYMERIGEDEYDFLMGHLRSMLENRFEQRNDKNENLDDWNNLYSTVFPLMKEKKAILSVIYDNEKPIQITLSYTKQKLLISSIPAYDIDYSKFGLGITGKYRLVEWCIQNGYEVMETGYGDLEYKIKWSNEVYNYDHHIIYYSNNLIVEIKAIILYQFYSAKEGLKQLKIKELAYKFFSIFKFHKKNRPEIKLPSIALMNPSDIDLNLTTSIVDIKTEAFNFLRRWVYDFQYSSQESSKDIKVYRLTDEIQSFLIMGSKKAQRIDFN